MKKLILIFTILLTTLISCNSNNHQISNNNDLNQVHCYKQFDEITQTWLWYYVLFGNNGQHYYYSSSSQITNYSSINNWSNSSPIGFSEYTAQDLGITSIDNSQLSSEFTESQGFEQSISSESVESNGFESSDNTSTESGGFENSDNSSSESSGFDSGSSDGGDSGGE